MRVLSYVADKHFRGYLRLKIVSRVMWLMTVLYGEVFP